MLRNIKKSVQSRFPFTKDLTKKLASKQWPDRSIAYYIGKRPLVLESDIQTRGASGSDSSVFFLTREWAKRGYDVTVYTNCQEKEGIYDGVRYVNYQKMNWYDTFDTLIIWRHPQTLPGNVKANRIWFDWHDIVYAPKKFRLDQLNRFDKIFAKSQYQRHLLPEISDDKFVIINNGADASILNIGNPSKSSNQLIYASRYYRGLEFMLTWGWPLIKTAIPDAELHLYYGWTKRDSSPKVAPWKASMLELMKQPGVIEHGNVGHQELMNVKSRASIHYYGCAYEEIDCISIRESAMVGCIPVTTNYAVFQEKDYCLKVDGDPSQQETQEALARLIIELLQKSPEELNLIREKVRQSVMYETWEQVAPKWLECIQ